VRERAGVRVYRVKAFILITLILAFSLEGRRDKTFYDILLRGGSRDQSLMGFKSSKRLAAVSPKECMDYVRPPTVDGTALGPFVFIGCSEVWI